MESMSMDMAMPSTTVSAAATTSSAMSMDSMSMGGSSCKISMLWNWDTVDTCFIAETWHVTSKGMFAGSCIGVICLVISLELLRRLGKEYDHLLLRQFQQRLAATNGPTTRTSESGSESGASPGSASKGTASAIASNYAVRGANTAHFRPNLVQQAIRALLHTLQFAVAYFVMLLAMYFNGYIIICIFIGAYLGSFIFGWESVTLNGPREEVTVCCG